MKYSDFKEEKALMESWRKFTEGADAQNEELLTEVDYRAIAEGTWRGLTVLFGFVSATAVTIVKYRKEIRVIAKKILESDMSEVPGGEKLKQLAEFSLRIISPFDDWDNVTNVALNKNVNTEELVNGLYFVTLSVKGLWVNRECCTIIAC